MQDEKIIYENDNGKRIEVAYSFPFFLQSITGTDGINTDITKVRGIGQDGTNVTNVNFDDRPIQIIGAISGETKDEVAIYRRELMQVFNPKFKGTLEYQYGNVKKRIRCNVENMPVFAKQNNSFKFQDFKIDLLCPNPFWQDIDESKSDVALWRGLFEFPLEILEEGIEVGFREPSLIVNVFNKGDVSCGIKMQFKALATVVNPSLFNINTREYFKLNKTMQAGETITVTTGFQNKKVTLVKNGVTTNGFKWIDLQSSFLQLDIGDNLFKFDSDQGVENLEVSIWHTAQYLGV